MRNAPIAALAALAATTIAHPHHPVEDRTPTLLQARQGASNAAERFRPKQKAKYYKPGAVGNGGGPTSNGYVRAATAFVQSMYPNLEFRQANDNYVSSSGIGHVYFKQTLYGFDIDDADVNVNVRPDGSIFSYGGSFYEGPFPDAPPQPSNLVEPRAGLQSVVQQLSLPIDPEAGNLIVTSETAFVLEGLVASEDAPNGQLVFYRRGDALVPAWRVETDLDDSFLTTYLAADEGNEILAVTDYVADASYEVFRWPLNDPVGHERTIERFNKDPKTSVEGWQTDDEQSYDVTRGNNGIAQPNTDGDAEFRSEPRPYDDKQDFREPWDASWEPAQYINASVVQLFYTSNKYHDVLYALGFNEQAGNFQDTNFGRGGQEGDSIILNTQDGSGTNNANFATPPDGRQGRMRMYRFTSSVPNRDSSFEAGIVIHEQTHGLSNRLTGGPANSRCLSTLESGGMGEGWSDFFATAVRVDRRDDRSVDYPIGDYATNNPRGIRAVVYSTSLTTNPYTYSTLNTLTRVHQYGTVWSSILYEVMWNLIDTRGSAPTDFPRLGGQGVPLDGKYLAMKLVIDGMALQPCSPTFLQARDAIVDADVALTGGEFQCELWQGFAKRGLGEDASDATGTFVDGFEVPAGAC